MATPTTAEIATIRRKTGDDATTFPDAEVEVIFDEISTSDRYSGYSRAVWVIESVSERFRNLRAQAALRINYTQGESKVEASQLYRHFDNEVMRSESERDDLITNESGGVGIQTAVKSKRPSVKREKPTE